MFAAESSEIAKSVVSRHKRSAALCFFEENVSTGNSLPKAQRQGKGGDEGSPGERGDFRRGADHRRVDISVATQSSATHTVHFIDSDWKLAFAPVP